MRYAPCQAKFRLPRNLESTKEFSGLWRPQLHCVAVLAAGVVECYYLLGPEQAADSNMQATLLAHTLDVVRGELVRRHRAMPVHLVVQADNTCREQRNQHMMKFGATLVLRGVFRSVSFTFLPVGHTHALPDQRFSMIGSALRRQPVLENPEAGTVAKPNGGKCHSCCCQRGVGVGGSAAIYLSVVIASA